MMGMDVRSHFGFLSIKIGGNLVILSLCVVVSIDFFRVTKHKVWLDLIGE